MTVATEAPPEPDAASAAAPDAGAEDEQAPPVARATNILVGIGLDDATMHRIRDAGAFDVSTESAPMARAQLLAISTRAERGQTPAIPPDVDPADTPIVVICHPGGEDSALAMMQQGCAGVIAEGNEGALAAFVDPNAHTEVLVAGFLENQGRGQHGRGRYRDPVTNLPEIASFEVRLGELIEAGPPPNVILTRITNLEAARTRTDSRAINLMRRRLASFFSDAARRCSCEVFSLDEATFGILDGNQSITDTENFARELIEITEAFRPAGLMLQLAVGAVSATEESEAASIQEQVEHAVMAAARGNESAFVTSDQVTVLLASVTEYNVAKLLVSLVDQKLPNPDGHSGRVADLACDIGRDLGYQDAELNNLRLAALLHDIGRIPIRESEDGDDLDYPERGARYVLASAGPEIADAIRHQAERWDGKGPGALSENDIPRGARVIAIANAADTWLHPPHPSDAVGPAELVAKIEAESGAQFDPELVDTARRLFGGA